MKSAGAAPIPRPSWGNRLERWLAREELRKQNLFWAIGIAFCVLRFVGLDKSPPGFFSDESMGAMNLICLAERGSAAWGDRWPLFVEGQAGGLYTPAFLYLGMLWVKVFGLSIVSARAFPAAFTTLATLGITLVARRLGGRNVSLYTFLAASFSPWAFQFARICWDPPMAPAFLAWALFFWLGRRRTLELVLAGVCASLALYAYPPTRVQAPLIFAALFLFELLRGKLTWRTVAGFFVPLLVVSIPLIRGTLDGSLNKRGNGEIVSAPAFVNHEHGIYSAPRFIVQTVFENLAAHFRPSFLFFRGDANLRHSTQFIGELGLVDDLALVIGALWVVAALLRTSGLRSFPLFRWRALTDGRVRVLAFAAFAFVCGVLPAALCWSDVPHALRSIGAWPFVALFSGVLLASASERAGRPFRVALLAVAALHAFLFVNIYFVEYPRISGYWFDTNVQHAVLEAGEHDPEAQKLIQLNQDGYRFYMIAYRGATCDSSEELLRARLEN